MTLLSPFLMLGRDIVYASEYVPTDDALDCWDGVAAAMVQASGRTLVFNSPQGSSRTYRFTDRTKGSLPSMRRGQIVWDANSVCDFSGWGTTGLGSGGIGTAFFRAEGVFAASVAVTVTADAKQNTATVADATGFVQGTRFILTTTEEFTPMEDGLGDIGEWCTVASVAGNVLTLMTDLRHTYDTALGTVKAHRAVDLVDLNLINPQIIGPGILAGAVVSGSGPRGDRGFEITNADRVHVTSGKITDSDLYGLMLVNAREVRIRDGSYWKTQVQPTGDSRQRYHIALANCCQYISITGCNFEGGTEQISPTLTGGGNAVSPEEVRGLKDTILVTGNSFRGAWRSGVGPHHAYVDLDISDNKFYSCNQAADMRLGGRFWNNTVKSSNIPTGGGGLDCGVQLGAGILNLDAGGNVFEDVARGYWMPNSLEHWRAPKDITIMNDVMRGVRQSGILLDYNGDNAGGLVDTDLGTLTIKADIQLTSVGTTGVFAKGHWTNADINVKVTGGPLTGAKGVLLTRADGSVSATGGPIDPIVKVKRTANIEASLVNFPVNGGGSVNVVEEIFGAP